MTTLRRGRGRTRRRRAARRGDPNLYLLENISINTADTVSNTTLFTFAEKSRMIVALRGVTLHVWGGATTNMVYCVIRRVPSGYSSPSITVASGLTAIVDQPDILCYGFCAFITGSVDENPLAITWLRPNMVFYEGDVLLCQIVSNTTSTGMFAGGAIEWESSYAN